MEMSRSPGQPYWFWSSETYLDSQDFLSCLFDGRLGTRFGLPVSLQGDSGTSRAIPSEGLSGDLSRAQSRRPWSGARCASVVSKRILFNHFIIISLSLRFSQFLPLLHYHFTSIFPDLGIAHCCQSQKITYQQLWQLKFYGDTD